MTIQRSHKMTPLIAAASLAVLGMVFPASAQNLLINPGFESPTVGGTESDTAAGWTFYSTARRATFFNHTSPGSWSAWMRAWEPGGGVFQNVTGITGGTNYSLNFWNLYQTGFITNGAVADARLTWNVGSPSEMLFTGNFATQDIWNQFTLNAVAPVGATSVVVSFDWTGATDVGGQQSLFFDDAVLLGSGAPPTGATWATNGSGDWNVSGNWSTGNIPNAVGAEAILGGIIGSAHTVYSDTAITVGSLTFNNPNTYVVAGAGSLTMQATSGSAVVKVQAGQQKINLPLFIKSNTTLDVAAGAGLRISDPMTINTGFVVSQTGSGTVTYESIVNVLTGAGIAMRNSTNMAALNLTGTGAATLTAGGAMLLKTASLSMAATSTVDMNDNDAIVVNGSYATVTDRIRNARNGNLWNQPGITSTTAKNNPAHNTTLGVLTGAQYHSAAGGTATFDGTAVANTDLLIKYTYYGDANFNGKVDGGDYARIDTTFNQEHTAGNISGWFNGDFDYNGKVDGADYGLIDSAFNSQLGTLRPALLIIGGEDPANFDLENNPGLARLVDHLDTFGESYAAGFLSAVPEPSACILMAAACGMITQARRRRR